MIKKEHVQKIIDNIGKTFSLWNLEVSINPFVDEREKLWHIIKKILHGYKLSDLPVKREAPVTLELLWVIKKKVKSTCNLFIAYLLISAFFYTIQSCKYVATSGEPQTKIISTDRIHFYKKRKSSIQ